MVYSDIIEYNIVGDTKTTLMRFNPFISNVKIGEIISSGQYMNYHSFLQNSSLKNYSKIPSIVSSYF